MDTKDIEKKSLEAHVELCAERYRFLEEKLETVEEKVTSLFNMLEDMKKMLGEIGQKRNDQLVAWGGGAILFLLSIIGYLLATFVVK